MLQYDYSDKDTLFAAFVYTLVITIFPPFSYFCMFLCQSCCLLLSGRHGIRGSETGKIFKTKTAEMIEHRRKLGNEKVRNFTFHENYLGAEVQEHG
jgi:hypothetical protein